MNEAFLKEAVTLFDTDDKWNSFLELIKNKDGIKTIFFKKLQIELNKRFGQNDFVDNWGFVSVNEKHFRWFLKDFGDESISLLFHFGYIFSIRSNPNFTDSSKIKEFLHTQRYSPLFNFLDRQDSGTNDWEIIRESGCFYFDSIFDGNFNEDQIAWFAGNKTEEFVNQIAEKVNRIRKNPEMTELLRELNEMCKKK